MCGSGALWCVSVCGGGGRTVVYCTWMGVQGVVRRSLLGQ